MSHSGAGQGDCLTPGGWLIFSSKKKGKIHLLVERSRRMTPVQGLWISVIKCKDGPYRVNGEISTPPPPFLFLLADQCCPFNSKAEAQIGQKTRDVKNKKTKTVCQTDFSHLQPCVVGNHFVCPCKNTLPLWGSHPRRLAICRARISGGMISNVVCFCNVHERTRDPEAYRPGWTTALKQTLCLT